MIDGDNGVVLIDGDTGVVKKIYREADKIELVSLNKKYEPLVFSKTEFDRLRIFGVVKKSIRSF